MNKLLLKPRPSLYLSLFRIAFALMMFVHFFGLIDRINNYGVEDVLNFPYPGLEWIPLFSIELMYAILTFGFLGTLLLALGWRHRLGSIIAAGAYAYFFFIDKLYYNNHFYLLILICLLFAFTDADSRYSVQKTKREDFVPRWQYLILQTMLCIVFFYGGIAKLNTGWLSGVVPSVVVEGALGKGHEWLEKTLTWGGLIFDLTIPILLFYKRTTLLAIAATAIFNVSNHLLFGDISLFPLLMILGALLFLERTSWNPFAKEINQKPASFSLPTKRVMTILGVFFLFQTIFPLRHYIIPGNAEWTGQGHFFAWRMKAYTKDIKMEFFVHDEITGEQKYPLNIGLDEYQIQRSGAFPDMVAHLAKYLEKTLVKSGEEAFEIRVNYWVNLNKTSSQRAIDPTVNLAKVKYRLWAKNHWVLPFKY